MTTPAGSPILRRFRMIHGLSIRYAESDGRNDDALLPSKSRRGTVHVHQLPTTFGGAYATKPGTARNCLSRPTTPADRVAVRPAARPGRFRGCSALCPRGTDRRFPGIQDVRDRAGALDNLNPVPPGPIPKLWKGYEL